MYILIRYSDVSEARGYREVYRHCYSCALHAVICMYDGPTPVVCTYKYGYTYTHASRQSM